MRTEKVAMSPEAVTNRLKKMEQLWELSVNLMQAHEIGEPAVPREKPFEVDRNSLGEHKARKHLENIPPVE